jgi:hypothetical protein
MIKLKNILNEAKVIKVKFSDNDQTLYFSDGEKSKVDYDGEFKYKGKWFDTSDMNSSKDLEKMLSKAFPGTKFIQTESVNEEKVYIDYLNKAKGFKQDRIKFNSYEDAVKWARKNFDKFSPDMIKYESVNESELKLGVKYINKQGKEGFIQTGGSKNPKDWFWFDGKTKHPYDKVKKELKPSKDQKKTGFGDYLKQGGRVWDNVNKDGESVNESAKSEKLASLINNVINKVDSSLSYKDFAMAVGKILKDEYGSHLYSSFVQELNKELKKENESIKLTSIMASESKDSIREALTISIRNLIDDLVPRDIQNATTPQQMERRTSFIRDLVKTLNYFYKQNRIDWRFADSNIKFKMYSKD